MALDPGNRDWKNLELLDRKCPGCLGMMVGQKHGH